MTRSARIGKDSLVAIVVIALASLVIAHIAHATRYGSNPNGQLAVHRMGEVYAAPWDSTYVVGHVDVTTSSAQWTVPDMGDAYQFCAIDTSVWLLGGASPTVAATAGGASNWVAAGTCTRPAQIKCLDADSNGVCDAHKIAYISSVNGKMVIVRYPRR